MRPEPGCQFASDTAAGVHPRAWEALAEAARGYVPSYGADDYTSRAAALIRDALGTPGAAVAFVSSGTAANALAVAHLCAPFESVVCHAAAHLIADECGAPGFFAHGAGLIAAPGPDGKLTPAAVREAATSRDDVHAPRAALLSITQATEAGSVYTLDELAALRDEARRLGLRVHLDGARFANAAARLGATPAEVVRAAGADVVCLGGTKNGMTTTEAVVFPDKKLADGFARRCKQAGHLPAKARMLSAPWVGMLVGGAWLDAAAHANRMADELAGAFAAAGVAVARPPGANAVFARLPAAVAAGLRARGWQFYDFGDEQRLMCSWATTAADVAALMADLERETAAAR